MAILDAAKWLISVPERLLMDRNGWGREKAATEGQGFTHVMIVHEKCIILCNDESLKIS